MGIITDGASIINQGQKTGNITTQARENIIAEVELFDIPENITINLTDKTFGFDDVLELIKDVVYYEKRNDFYIFYQKAKLITKSLIKEGKAEDIIREAEELKIKGNEKSKIVYPVLDVSDFMVMCQAKAIECFTMSDAVLINYSDEEEIKDLMRFAKETKQRFRISSYIVLLSDEAKSELGISASGNGFNFSDGVLSFSLAGDINKLGATIKALEQKGKAKVLSNPFLVIDDRETGSIKSGVDVPVITPATANYPVMATFKEAVIGLSVMPIYTGNDNIKLNISISKDFPDYKNVIAGNVPINKNTIDLKITSKVGEIIALGGIIENNDSENKRYFLFIPVGSDKNIGKSELYIFLRVDYYN